MMASSLCLLNSDSAVLTAPLVATILDSGGDKHAHRAQHKRKGLMWRRGFVSRAATVGSRMGQSSQASQCPYQRVLQMLQSEGEGLPAAVRVFEEFRAFYRQTMTMSESIPPTQVKPLQHFCRIEEDTEPFALIMMKVLCDLRKLDEVRFLFAQCMLELSFPSVELFNVYLLAISLTDTFNQYEIENVVETMRAKRVEPDLVTRLSLFIVYMRLGQDYSSWWPQIREEVLHVAKAGLCGQHPLLEVRLQHCFQTLLRVHYDVSMIQECFELMRRVSKQNISSRLLLPYMLLSANNAATPPATTVELVKLLEEGREEDKKEDLKIGCAPSEGCVWTGGSLENARKEAAEPVLSNELTAMKLMAKCAKWGDVESATYVRDCLLRSLGVISPENQTTLTLLYLEVLARAGMLKEALALLEDSVPETHCHPGPRPKLFLDSKKVTLLNADPIMTLVRLVAFSSNNVEEGLTLLEERRAAGGDVSHKSLNILLEACVLLKDKMRSSMVFAVFPNFGACRTSRTFLLMLLASPNVVASVRQLPDVFAEMADLGIEASPGFLRGVLDLAIVAQDVSAAMQIVEYHEAKHVSIDSKLSLRLLRLLCLVVDVESVRRLLAVMRATQSPIDRRYLSLCVATFKKWAIPCDDLVTC